GSHFCYALPSDPASRRRPCASLTLHLHPVGKRTFTSKLSNMLGTPGWRMASPAMRFAQIEPAGPWSRRTPCADNAQMVGVEEDVNRRAGLALRQPGVGSSSLCASPPDEGLVPNVDTASGPNLIE